MQFSYDWFGLIPDVFISISHNISVHTTEMQSCIFPTECKYFRNNRSEFISLQFSISKQKIFFFVILFVLPLCIAVGCFLGRKTLPFLNTIFETQIEMLKTLVSHCRLLLCSLMVLGCQTKQEAKTECGNNSFQQRNVYYARYRMLCKIINEGIKNEFTFLTNEHRGALSFVLTSKVLLLLAWIFWEIQGNSIFFPLARNMVLCFQKEHRFLV